MNFLFILSTFYPNIGGIETATFEICKKLKEKSHNVYVLTTTKSNYYPDNKKLANFEKIDGIQIFRVLYELRFFNLPIKALYLATKYQIDYIYITDYWGVVALFLKKVFQIPFVYVLNGYNPICPRGILFHQRLCQGFGILKCLKYCHQFSVRFLFSVIITRLLVREAQPIIANSKAVQNAYHSYFGKIPIKVIYYGIDTEKFRPLPRHSIIFPPKLKESDKILLFFGRLIKERGVFEFLQHFQKLFQKIDCKLLIVGLGLELPRIKAETHALDLQQKVIFLGVLRNQELINVINLARVVILPIQFPEPLSLVVLEAMACAKPVVSFKLGGVKELLGDGKTGLLIPPNDWDLFINKITQLLQNDTLCATIGEGAQQRVEKYFDWNRFIEQFLNAIR